MYRFTDKQIWLFTYTFYTIGFLFEIYRILTINTTASIFVAFQMGISMLVCDKLGKLFFYRNENIERNENAN